MNRYQETVRRTLQGSAMATAILLLVGSASAQFNSPVGTWDFVLSGGGQQGIAILTFSPDNTFAGQKILATTAKNLKISDRGLGSDGGRTPTTDTNAPAAKTNLFGFSEFSGFWSYDLQGRVIGNYSIEVQGEGTNVIIHGISFVGKPVPGKRFTMVASLPQGKVTCRGVPYRDLIDVSGQWNGFKKIDRQTFIEFFTLSPLGGNTYFMEGIGPGYDYQQGGYSILSAQKKIAFAVVEFPAGDTNGFLRASAGGFNPKKGTAKTKGIIEPDKGLNFNASLAPVFVP